MHSSMTFLVVMILGACGASFADEWMLPEECEYHSPNKKHVLKVVPDEEWPDRFGYCKATLYKTDGENRRKEVWSRHLINNHAPLSVFVADSGDYILTMDESGSVGELPVVIYGRNGELIRVHSTDSLGLAGADDHIKQTISSYWWNEDSISFFGPDEKFFFIRLHWKKQLLIELSNGNLMDEAPGEWRMSAAKWKAIQEDGKRKIKKHAITLLKSKDPQEQKTGALVCGQEKFKEAIPKLKVLLKSNAAYSSRSVDNPWMRVYYVRKAAKKALESMKVSTEGIVIEEIDTEANARSEQRNPGKAD